MAIVSNRFEIKYEGNSSRLLDFLRRYFDKNVRGEVIRFAIEDKRGKTLFVHASVRE